MISNEKYNLCNLPPEIIGNILKCLTVYTGSKDILNDSDIPVIMRYSMNLARTCKQLYASFNDPIATDMFVHALSKKYGQSADHFAAVLDTLGARKWLWLSMEKQGLDKSYQVIQDIYDLVTNVKKEVNESGLEFDMDEGRLGWPSPDPYCDQTKEGFSLNINWVPHLSTPFGKIKLFGGGSYSRNSPLSVSEIFIKRLDAVLEDVSGAKEGNFFEIVVSDNPGKIREITEKEMIKITLEDAKKRKRTQNLIVHNCGGQSFYKIRKVGDQRISELSWPKTKEEKRNDKTVKSMWRMLEQKRQGKDPFIK